MSTKVGIKYPELLRQSVTGSEVSPEEFQEYLASYGISAEQFDQHCDTYEQRMKWLDDIVAGPKAARDAYELEAQRRDKLAEGQKLVDEAADLQGKARRLWQIHRGGEVAKMRLNEVMPPQVAAKKKALLAERQQLAQEGVKIEKKITYGNKGEEYVVQLRMQLKEIEARLLQNSRELTRLCELCEQCVWPEVA